MKKCPFCAEEIQDEAIVCKHCGRDLAPTPSAVTTPAGAPPKKKQGLGLAKLAGLGCLGLMLLSLIGFVLQALGISAPSSSTTRQPTSAPAIAPARPASDRSVTMAKFSAITEGMRYEQVKGIIGAEGEVLSSSDIAGIKTIMYAWKNANGSNMNAMFQDGRLVQKAQFGLR